MKHILSALAAFLCFNAALAQYSGGTLLPQQAAFDVNFYDLNINIHPDTKLIDGSVLCRAKFLEAADTLVLDLVNYFTVDSVIISKNTSQFSAASFSHINGLIKTVIPGGSVSGDMVSARVYYHQNGIIPNNLSAIKWDVTPSGYPWVDTYCEVSGSDWWWPCKEHPSDEADSVSLSFTVPNILNCASNGKFKSTVDNNNGTSTYNWFVSTPINNYCIAFYAAPYSVITDDYMSVSGDTIPFFFWVIFESLNEALQHMDVFKNEFNFLESINGPFPFASEKHGFAQSNYYGMEHQTVIAYGHKFQVDEWNMDYYHFHELAHEWWGNLVTAKNWNDVWIHEGIATYTEALYVEHLAGSDRYLEYMLNMYPSNNHEYALAPREEQNALAIYTNDPYNRGAWVMHTLRWYLGDKRVYEPAETLGLPRFNQLRQYIRPAVPHCYYRLNDATGRIGYRPKSR